MLCSSSKTNDETEHQGSLSVKEQAGYSMYRLNIVFLSDFNRLKYTQDGIEISLMAFPSYVSSITCG